jgi:Uma2 family endonuclease
LALNPLKTYYRLMFDRKPWTVSQFLEWEERQPLRYEFDGAQAVAMTGGTAAHDAIAVNLGAALVTRLRGKPCRPHGGNLKIQTATSIRYPDAFVSCSPIDPRATVTHEPVVMFEVLSQSTAGIERIVKNREYQSLPSVMRYVMQEQDQIAATVFERRGDDWVGHVLADDAVLAMPEIGIEVPLAELYEGIDLAAMASGESVPAS